MLQSLEACLAQRNTAPPCPTEADYYALWCERDLSGANPVDAAVTGALLADSLPWVFTAGYQATLRNAFPLLPAGGWAAFAATEDQHDPDAHPGVVLADAGSNVVLNGHKSWVAHSALVDHLIITVNDPGGDKYRARGVYLARDTPGLTITHRDKPAFLAAMSQGFLRLDNVEVPGEAVFEFEPIRQFGRTEAKFVMLATSAFMLSRTSNNDALESRLLTTAAALVALLQESVTSRQVYAAIDREFQACVEAFEASCTTGNIQNYGVDRRLFAMYTARIQRRGGYARAEAAGH